MVLRPTGGGTGLKINVMMSMPGPVAGGPSGNALTGSAG